MSPGINGGHSVSQRTGTVPKIKSCNHNDVAQDVSYHHIMGPSAPLLGVCASRSGHSGLHQSCEFGLRHMNNNLNPGSLMDWQPVFDATAQTNQQPTRIRKESNTLSSGAGYDVTDVEINCGTAAGGSGNSGVVSSVTADNSSAFCDVPLQIFNQATCDEEEVRWDQEAAAGSGNGSRRQQKSNNICEQAQVASRLHQIRDYINQTSGVMEQLQAAGTPQHMEQWLRLHDMLDGLKDSEMKLVAIQDTLDRLNCEDAVGTQQQESEVDSVGKSNDVATRRNELKVKVEESQRKLMELREQQAALLALKHKAQEQLKEARAAQGALLAATEEDQDDGITVQDCKRLQERLQCLHNFYELAQSVGCSVGSGDPSAGEVVQLQNKLEELQAKKMQINQLVSRFDSSSSLTSNSQPIAATINCESTGSNSNVNSCGGQISYGNGVVQTTEEKIAELNALKEQRAKMQNALMNMSKSAQQTSTNSDYPTLLNSLQEPEGGTFNDVDDNDDNDQLGRINSLCNFKQDNRAQAISQNQQQLRQQQPHSSVPSTGTWIRGGNQSITPTCIVQHQLQSKSLKLQEAKARLHHLQQLLGLVEEFREAGKPIPEKILLLLNSPDGPLSSEDNFDLGLPPARSQNPRSHSSISSSTSSLISLFQPQSNSVSVSNAVNPSSISKERPNAQPHLPNRSDVGRSIQNFYQCPPTGVSSAPQLHLHQQHLAQEQQPSVVAKQKNNAAKLCSKTHELEEWMRKDDDPVSSINTDVHSQTQPAAGGYQDILNASTVWRHSPDYSSDDGGRSQEENESEKVPPPVTGGNGMAPARAEGGSNCSTGFASVGLTGNDVSRTNSKDAPGNTNYLSRDISLEGAAGGGVVDDGGPGASSNVWRKNSTGSCCSLPVCCGNNRGIVHSPCYCSYNNRQDAVTAIAENLSAEDFHQPLDNNTGWVLQHISQLQAQLQHMCLTIMSKNSNRGVLIAPPSALGPPPFCQQQQSGSGSDNSSSGRAADTLSHNLNCKLPYQHLICNSLNQCCQLIWHQQCELATLKEAFHNIQHQQEEYNLHSHLHQDGRSPSHFTGDGGTAIVNEPYNSRSNLRRCDRSHYQQRNRLTADIQPSSSPSLPQPPLISLPPPHYFFPSYGNNLNPTYGFQHFRHPSPVGSYMSSPTSTLNNQVPPGNRANNYWDNFRSYSRQNLLSARSKCNEGRMSSSANGDCNSSPNERYRSGVDVRRNSGGAREREVHPAWGGTSTSSASSAVLGAAVPCTGASACLPSLQQQQVNSLVMNVNVTSEEVTAHNTPNRKEKLNAYQSEGQLFPNCLLPAQSVSFSSVSVPQPVDGVDRDGMSVTSNKHKPSVCDGSSLFKCDSSKGASRKSCKSKSQTSQGSLVSGANNYGTNNSTRGVHLNNDESFVDGVLIEPNTINDTQPQQKSIARDDPVRNSNCKRRLLTNNTNANVYNKCNSLSFSENESNSQLPADSLEESMYSEVAALISVNEQRPDYLLQLFKDLKRIDSDHDRQAALLTIHNLASKSATSPLAHRLNVDQSQAAPGEVVMSNKRVQQQQPHNIPWRDTKDSAVDSSSSCALPMNCRKLDGEVQSILVNMLPFLKSHISETCTPSLLESVRNLVLHLVPSPQNIPQQLDALLEDSLFKFQGCRMHSVYDELISVVADVLISELTFLHLTTSVNGPVSNGGDSSRQNEGGFHVVEDEDEEDRVCAATAEEEEGAVGGVDMHNNCHTQSCSNNRHQRSAVNELIGCSSKSDPVVSEAELAEADQSSRHSNVICSNGLSSLISEPQLGAVALMALDSNKELHGHVEINGDFILPITMDNNTTVEYEDSSKTLPEANQEIKQKKSGTGACRSTITPPSSPASVIDAWAVEQDRERLDHAAVNDCNNLNNDGVPNGFVPLNS